MLLITTLYFLNRMEATHIVFLNVPMVSCKATIFRVVGVNVIYKCLEE